MTKSEFYIVSADSKVASQFEDAISTLAQSKVKRFAQGKEFLKQAPKGPGFVVIDNRLPDINAFELCRQVRATTTHRVLIANYAEDKFAAPIARFCGADGSVQIPVQADELMDYVKSDAAPAPIDELLRKSTDSTSSASFPESFLQDAMGDVDQDVVEAIIDPETKLFNFAFLSFKLDEEFKRATRFKYPLTCVMLGFDGEASSEILLELAGIFLSHSRDTDVLGRFDLNAFLFLLPNTSTQGAQIMAKRVAAAIKKQKLVDLVGEELEISIGIACCPDSSILQREDLLARARAAYENAQQAGGGVEVSHGSA